MDPFDFRDLRRHAPKHFGMDSLMDALASESPRPEPERVESEDVSMGDVTVDSTPDIEDVHMAGLDPEPRSGSQHRAGTDSASVASALDNPGPDNPGPENHDPENHGPENHALDHPALDKLSPPSIPIATDPKIFRTHPPILHTVMAPTQAGAHQAEHAIAPYEHVNLPIPAPWHANPQYLLSTYLQLAFNVAVLALAGWLLLVVKDDVGKKIKERRSFLIHEAAWCRERFLENQCQAGHAAPYLVENKECLELERCMEVDPEDVRWLSMFASLLAEILNEFVLPLQLRTIIGMLSVVGVLAGVVFANYWFGFWRARSYHSMEGH